MSEFCVCGSLKQRGKCTNRNCPEIKSKRRIWMINGTVLDFGQPITYQEASISADRIKELQEEIRQELRK